MFLDFRTSLVYPENTFTHNRLQVVVQTKVFCNVHFTATLPSLCNTYSLTYIVNFLSERQQTLCGNKTTKGRYKDPIPLPAALIIVICA